MVNRIKPSSIRIDASTICQLKCPSCPSTTGNIQTVIGKGFLKFIDFEKVINDNPWIAHIELSNYGEIFLNSDLLKMLKYARERKVLLTAENGVNLNNVDETLLEGLVKYKFYSMTCSIDGASNETYKLYRVKGNFNSVIQHIRMINEFKKKYRSEYPLLTWQFIAFGHNEHEIATARKLAEDLNMKFILKLSWNEEFSPLRNKEIVRRENGLGVASRKEYEKMFGINYVQGLCYTLWTAPQINWDGKVLGCPRNFWRDLGGNAFIDGLLWSLSNEKILYTQDMLLGRSDPRADIPCTTCDIYSHMKAKNKWLEKSKIVHLMEKKHVLNMNAAHLLFS